MQSLPHRVKTIDAFRCLAVLAVVLYHYYCRFSLPVSDINYLPYQYEPSILRFGFYGVQLFFVISGFVIAKTLRNCSGYSVFIGKRLARLLPALLICSLITLLFEKVSLLPFPFLHSRTYLDFLPELSFTPPALWNYLLGRTDIEYIDGVYWSLYVEMVFYLCAGVVYFAKPKSFTMNWIVLTLILVFVRILTSPKLSLFFPPSINTIFHVVYELYFSLSFLYWIYFGLGIFFYALYEGQNVNARVVGGISVLVLFELFFLESIVLRILFLGIILLFLVFIFKRSWLSILDNAMFLRIGLISYPIYLLHEKVGIILMHSINALFDTPELTRFMPIFVIVIIIFLAELVYRFLERPIGKYLQSRFF